MTDAEVTTLGSLAEQGRLLVNDGYRTKKSELDAAGVPILRVAEVRDGYLAPSLADRVSEAHRPKFGSKTSAPNDVVVTTKGTVGRVAMIRPADPEFVYSPQVCFFRCLDRSIEPRFLYYWFSSSEFRAQATGVKSQTDMADYINLADIRSLRITLPSPHEQSSIADVLGALDDKIESNRRLCATTIHLCRSLLVDDCSETVRVGDVAELDKGLSYKGSGLVTDPDAGTPMANLANFGIDGWLKPTGLKYYRGQHKERHIAEPGELLVANTDLTQQRAILGRPALVPPGSRMLFTHHLFAVRFHTRPELRLPLWASLHTPAFRERAEGFATGTTVAGLPREALTDFEFGVPPHRAISEARDLLNRAWAAERESSTLGQMRDALLPELLSGRLRVPDAEDPLEAVS